MDTSVKDRAVKLFGVACVLIVVALFGTAITTRLIRHTAKPVGQGIFSEQPLWVFQTSEEIITTPLADESGNILVRTATRLYSLESSTGSLLWQSTLPHAQKSSAPLALWDNLLLVPGKGDSSLFVYRYSQKSIERLWDDCPQCDRDASFFWVETMAVSEGRLFVARSEHRLTAYNLASGHILWEHQLPSRAFVQVTALNDIVYAAITGEFTAFDGASGQEIWSVSLGDFIGQYDINAGIVYAITGAEADTKLVALSLDTHTILWEVSIPSKQPTARNFVASEGAVVYVANDALLAFNAETGELEWEFTVGRTLQEPIITDKAVYVRDSAHGLRLLDGTKGLYALHPETGQQIGFVELINRPSDEIHAQLNPTISDGVVIIPVGTDFIFAYQE